MDATRNREKNFVVSTTYVQKRDNIPANCYLGGSVETPPLVLAIPSGWRNRTDPTAVGSDLNAIPNQYTQRD
jgi:hypothetical protein